MANQRAIRRFNAIVARYGKGPTRYQVYSAYRLAGYTREKAEALAGVYFHMTGDAIRKSVKGQREMWGDPETLEEYHETFEGDPPAIPDRSKE